MLAIIAVRFHVPTKEKRNKGPSYLTLSVTKGVTLARLQTQVLRLCRFSPSPLLGFSFRSWLIGVLDKKGRRKKKYVRKKATLAFSVILGSYLKQNKTHKLTISSLNDAWLFDWTVVYFGLYISQDPFLNIRLKRNKSKDSLTRSKPFEIFSFYLFFILFLSNFPFRTRQAIYSDPHWYHQEPNLFL